MWKLRDLMRGDENRRKSAEWTRKAPLHMTIQLNRRDKLRRLHKGVARNHQNGVNLQAKCQKRVPGNPLNWCLWCRKPPKCRKLQANCQKRVPGNPLNWGLWCWKPSERLEFAGQVSKTGSGESPELGFKMLETTRTCKIRNNMAFDVVWHELQ